MTKPSAITKAVIPAAGHGTRLRPLTLITPKEMLPLGRKPAVEYIVEELQTAGVTDIIFVVSAQKQSIREYFGDTACEGRVRVSYVLQKEQKGLADAVLHAEEWAGGEPFILALGDSVITSGRADFPVKRLAAAYLASPAFAAIAVERVPISDCIRYGMVKPKSGIHESFEIDALVEKPAPAESPSDLAIGGRYVFDAGIFDFIRRTPKGVGGEYQITDSIKLAMAEGNRVWCVPLQEGERRYDIGNFRKYCEAFAAMCMLDPELASAVRSAVERE